MVNYFLSLQGVVVTIQAYILSIITLIISFAGCEEKKIKTVDYFSNNPKAMEDKLIECANSDSATLDESKECKNARIAKNSMEK